jgi:basic amino acid/polyamine antiporter, APA family
MTDRDDRMFARSSSGFVRGFSAWDVFVFNVLGYATGLSLATNPTILGGLYPHADIYAVLVFGFLLSLCTGYVYGAFAAQFPRQGGDYVYIGRTLSPALGFVASWGFTWSQVYGAGVFSGWAIRDSLSPAFLTFGYTIQSSAFVEVGTVLAKPALVFGGGLVVLVVCSIISLLGHRHLSRMLNLLFLLAIVSAILMIVPFLTTSHDEFVGRFNDFMQRAKGIAGAYNLVLEQAGKAGLVTGQPPNWWDGFRALPVGYLIFFGFTYSVYVGGEVQKPQWSQVVGIVSALLLGLFFSLVGLGSYYWVVGQDFNNAVAVTKGLSDSILPAGGSMVFFSGVLTTNPLASFVMNFGSFLWFFLLPLIMIVLCVRNIFAWSIDRVVPEKLSEVSPGNRPVTATVAVAALATLCLALDSLLGFPYVNYIVLFSLCYMTTGVAAAVFGWRRDELFRLGPPLVKKMLFGTPLMLVMGIVAAAMFLFILYSALTNNDFSGVQGGYIPVVVLMGVYISGYLVWTYARYRAQKEGRPDLEKLRGYLPPE